LADFLFDEGVIMLAGFRDVLDHVDFIRPDRDRIAGFEDFRLRGHLP
jgi:hypothetical protein